MIVKTIRFDQEVIVITMDPGKAAASMDSTLTRDIEDRHHYVALSAVESIILAHACAGVNIESKEYVTGVEVAVNAIENNLG